MKEPIKNNNHKNQFRRKSVTVSLHQLANRINEVTLYNTRVWRDDQGFYVSMDFEGWKVGFFASSLDEEGISSREMVNPGVMFRGVAVRDYVTMLTSAEASGEVQEEVLEVVRNQKPLKVTLELLLHDNFSQAELDQTVLIWLQNLVNWNRAGFDVRPQIIANGSLEQLVNDNFSTVKRYNEANFVTQSLV